MTPQPSTPEAGPASVAHDLDVVDLDCTGDLYDGLVEEAVQREVACCQSTEVDQDPHLAAKLINVSFVDPAGLIRAHDEPQCKRV